MGNCRVSVLFLTLLQISIGSVAQQAGGCRSFGLSDYDRWHDVSAVKIKSDGSLMSWEWNPQKGDGKLIVFSPGSGRYDTIHRGYDAAFLPSASGVVAKVKPYRELIRKQTLDGVKKDKQTKDSLLIRLFEPDTTLGIAGVASYKTPEKAGDLIAWLFEEGYGPRQDTSKTDTARNATSKPQRLKQADKVYTMGVFNTKSFKINYFHHVSVYAFSDYGTLCYVTQNQRGDSSFVWLIARGQTQPRLIDARKGWMSSPAADPEGRQWAFLHTADTSKRKMYSLWYHNQKNEGLRLLADSSHHSIPVGLSISADYAPRFADDGSALYFGLGRKPEPLAKDTLTPDEKVSLDIWHWKDGQLQSQQLKNLEREQKRSWLAVFYPAQNRLLPLATEPKLELSPQLKNHLPVMVGIDASPYEILSSWEQSRYVDVWLVDRLSGRKQLLLQKHNSIYSLSPSGNYLLYYNIADSAWYGLEIKGMKTRRLTQGQDIFYDERNDIPRPAASAGFAGWLDDKSALVNSASKLWLLDLSGKCAPQTIETPDDMIVRAVITKRDEPILPAQLPLTAFNKLTKEMAMGSLDLFRMKATFNPFEPLFFSRFVQARDANAYLYTAENYNQYPELHFTHDLTHTGKIITDANPWKTDYCRGEVKLVKWRSFNGDQLEGLLYFPANYDASKSYPMIVYFYEQHSEGLHRYLLPRPSRSTVNIPEYTSRGYFIFTPDIRYRDGQPGRSAYDAVVSGTQAMLERFPSIDPNRLGIQGQSWGGYQTAWLITQTNMFRAAMAGAPVSNMTSAYGGIRWESGVVRQFQYEEGQSRIGASLWDKLPYYIENSPLFFVDRLQTPLLIMANDNDGAVPWTQGIELFTALRRLGKPSWMLNYNNAPHNLSRRADTEDFTLRLQQFFDHYLMDAPMPDWMKYGVPAIDKGKK